MVVDKLTFRDKNAGTWVSFSTPSVPLDLLKLQGGFTALLGQQPLPAGTYDQIRLVLDSAYIVDANGSQVPLETPSAETSGLKLKGDIAVPPDSLVDIMLDFDPMESIVETGNGKLLLKPVIEVESATIIPGAATAATITAANGGTLSLPSGATVTVPPGALPADGIVSMVQDVESPTGGTLIGPAFEFFPAGLTFLTPVTVTLPYDPHLVPSWTNEGSIFLAWDWQAVSDSTVNPATHTVTGQVSHFSTGQISAAEQVTNPYPGVWLFQGGKDNLHYAVAVVDTWEPSVTVRTVEAGSQVAGSGGVPGQTVPWSDGSTHGLESVGALTEGWRATDSLAVAINTLPWDGSKQDDDTDHVYVKTACANGHWRRFGATSGKAENHFAIPAAVSQESPMAIEPFANADAIPSYLRYNVLGATFTTAWEGEFQSSKGDRYEQSTACLDVMSAFTCKVPATGVCELDSERPRTAIGMDSSTRYLILFAGSGPSVECVLGNPIRYGSGGFSMYDVYRIITRTRNLAGQLVQASRAIDMDGGHSVQMRSKDSLLVTAHTLFTPADGAPVIAGLAVISTPMSTNGIIVDDVPLSQLGTNGCDATGSFCLHGPAEYWTYRSGVGYPVGDGSSGMWFTRNNDQTHGEQNSARFIPNIPLAGLYDVFVHVPSNCSTTTCGAYRVFDGNTLSCAWVDQSKFFDSWVKLGTYAFDAGHGTAYVEVSDLTYEPYLSREVGIDAIKLVVAGSGAVPAPGGSCSGSAFDAKISECAAHGGYSVPCQPN